MPKTETPVSSAPVSSAPVSTFAPVSSALPRGLSTEQATFDALQYFARGMPDPDDMLRKSGMTRKDLRRIETDDEVIQCRDKRVDAVIACPWRIEPNTTRAGKFIAEEIAPWIENIVTGAMNAVFYGYSVSEIVYLRRTDGRIGIEEVTEKPFEWFVPHSNRDLRFFPPGEAVDVAGLPTDPRKYLLTVSKGSYRNPYGEALYSRLWWPVFFRTNGWKSWLQFLERFGTPMLIGKTQADPEKMAAALSAAVQDAIIVTGATDEIAAVEIGSDGKQFEMFETAVTARIQKSILGQTLTSNVGKSGSFAAAKVHQDVQQEKRNADIRMITRTVQKLVDHLCTLNNLPALTFIMADDTGLEKDRADRDALLVEKGVLTLTKEYLLDRYDYREGDFELVAAPVQPTAQPAALPPPVADANLAAHRDAHRFANNFAPQFTADQMVIERGIDATLSQINAPITGADIKQAILAATSPEDLEDRLAVLLQSADRHQFNAITAQALFAADILGYAHAAPVGRDSSRQTDLAAPTINLTATLQMPEGFGAPSPVTVQMAAPNVQVDVHVPEQAAPIIHNNIHNNIEPTPVTVQAHPGETQIIIQHPTKAVQTVERDAETQEITATVTQYEGFND